MSCERLEGTHQRVAIPMEHSQQEQLGKPPKLSAAAQQRMERQWHWTSVVMACLVLGLLAQAGMQRDVAEAGRQLYLQITVVGRGGGGAAATVPATPLEEQLMGCRTFRTQPLPFVNTSASLAVLDTYTPEQAATAEAFTAAVSACTDFACLQRANKLPRAPGQFRYPHFFILGFPKCATTSLYCHLIQHPQVQYPQHKEPHTLKDKCNIPGLDCPTEVQREYVVDVLNMKEAAASKFTRATLDGSTHYAAEGHWMAAGAARLFPWLKVVIAMRDPISQALAMHLHNLSHGRPDLCFEANNQRIYSCIVDDLEDDTRSRYGPKVAQWLSAFPASQVLLLQYESLINNASMARDLTTLKSFLEMEPHAPSDELPLTNWKHMRGGPDAIGRYWNMTRSEYQHLVDLAHRNTMEVVQLFGKEERQRKIDFLRSWELVWRLNLRDNCEEGPQGNCKIVAS